MKNELKVSERVAVVGASYKPTRYSYKAMTLLMEHNHTAIPISILGKDILEQKGYRSISELDEAPDTVTMYVGAAYQDKVIEDIVAIKPKRVIFNPGTENPVAYAKLEEAGIKHLEACTLVLLTTDQF